MNRYHEVLDLIEDAEQRSAEATTEWEFETAEAELEQLYAERDALEKSIDSYNDELSNLRKTGF